MTSLTIKIQLSIFLGTILAISSITDLRGHKIPNILIYPTILVALAFHVYSNGFEGFLFSMSGLFLGILLLIGPYLMGGMGAGDAKLMGAVGAVVGPKGVFFSFLFSALAGGVYALILINLKREQFRGLLRKTLIKLQMFFITREYNPEDRNPTEPKLCYGIAIAVGAFVYMALDFSGYVFPI